MITPQTFVALRHGDASAVVDAVGGELRRWCSHGQELLWDADPRWWPRSSPVLFPLVGRLRDGHARIGGKTYSMPVHGFAKSELFEVRATTIDEVTLGLESSDATRTMFPFDFDLRLSYRLREDRIDATFCVVNTGEQSMPFAIGVHPGLRWPFSASSADGHSIVFDERESPEVPMITADGLLSRSVRALPMSQRRLSLCSALFEHDAVCFLDARSRRLRFESPDGAAIVVSARGFPHWALWTKPGAPLLCIEAWTGYADLNDFEGEFADRPSMCHLAPGAQQLHAIEMHFWPAKGTR